MLGDMGEEVEKVWGPALVEFRGRWVGSWREKSRQVPNEPSVPAPVAKSPLLRTRWDKFSFIVLLAGLYSMGGGFGSWFRYFE